MIMVFSFLASSANAKIPSWAQKNTITKDRNILSVVCNGTGPSVEISRKDALSSCKSSASQYLNKKTQIKTLSVQTEKSVGFHEEITENSEILNLSCIPQNDEILVSDSGSYETWLKCKFDLTDVKILPIEHSLSIENKTDTELSSLRPLVRIVKQSDDIVKILTISSVPKCDSIIIKGQKSRTILCRTNPQLLELQDGDKNLIVRAKNYLPKTLNIKEENYSGSINIILEKN